MGSDEEFWERFRTTVYEPLRDAGWSGEEFIAVEVVDSEDGGAIVTFEWTPKDPTVSDDGASGLGVNQ